MSIEFLGKPHLRIIIAYHVSQLGINIQLSALNMIVFKNHVNEKFYYLKNFLDKKCKCKYKINQKMPYIHCTNLYEKSLHGKECIRYAYVDVYFMSSVDMANVKIRWKPFIFDK